jgi:hypothetical protein
MSVGKRLTEEQMEANDFDEAMDSLQRVYENGEMNEWEQGFFENMWQLKQDEQQFSERMVSKVTEMRQKYDHFISYLEASEK